MLEFTRDYLLHASRTMPIIMISPCVGTSKTLVDGFKLQPLLRGSAIVAILEDTEAAQNLTLELEGNSSLSCYAGAVRIYYPGFSPTPRPDDSKIYLASRIRYWPSDRSESSEESFLREISKNVQGFLNRRPPSDDFVARVHEEIDKRRRATIEMLQQPGKSVLEDEEFRKDYERILDDNRELNKCIRELEQQIIDLHKQIEIHEANWTLYQSSANSYDYEDGREDDAEVEDAVDLPRFSTVLDALRRSQEDFTGPLIFLPSAEDSARDSNYCYPDKVYEFFSFLHKLASQWQNSNGSLGMTWKEAFRGSGFEYKGDISQTAETKWNKDYTFSYHARDLLFGPHITLGSSHDPRHCLSIHWYRDDDRRVLAIGHCGRHLPNTKTS